MSPPPPDYRPAIISGAGGLVVLLTVIFSWQPGHFSQWLLLLGAALAIGGAFYYRRRVQLPDLITEQEKEQLQRDRERAREEKRALDLYKSDIEEEALMLEKRRHKLSLQLAQTVGWWDLPQQGRPEETAALEEMPSDDRDRQVLAFCKEESERLFDKIINNEYVRDGVLQVEDIYRDVIHLFEGVARVYQPGSDHPLLETSMEQVLRFIHNVSLQLLVQLEQLPLDVKSYNIRDTYRFVKKAMDYYGMYRKVTPYWNMAKPAIFLGRFALGANPIALGLSWTITELASLGGKKISSRYTRKYGLRMFHEAIRIVGSETAAVYGADFRDRDPDWVYATELIDMVHHFPPANESLEAALKELSALPLHSEYDRIYLFRCMANRFSAKPRDARSRQTLAMSECVRVAQRLEGFFQRHYPNEEVDRIKKWQRIVETRLGVRLQLGEGVDDPAKDEQLQAAFYSTASYLLGHKLLELDTAELHLRDSRIAAAMEGAALTKALVQVREAPPMVFDYPTLALGKDVVNLYLQDLLDFQLNLLPREINSHLMEEAATYFREKPETWIAQLHTKGKQLLLGQLLPEAPHPAIDDTLAHALLNEMGPDERLQLLYPVTSVEGPVVFNEDYKSLWLIGTTRRPLILFGFGDLKAGPPNGMPLWKPGTHELSADFSKTFLTQALRLQGGVWNQDHVRVDTGSDAVPTIRMRSRRGSANEGYFQALEDRCQHLGKLIDHRDDAVGDYSLPG